MAVRSPLICSVGAGGLLKVHAQFVGDDGGQRRLAQSRRAVEQHVIERLAARAGGLDGYREVLFDLLLADELRQPPRAQLQLKRSVVLDDSGRDDPLAIGIPARCGHLSGWYPETGLEAIDGLPLY